MYSFCNFQKSVILHELGHALGFQHEQTRPDRNGFVSIRRYSTSDWSLHGLYSNGSDYLLAFTSVMSSTGRENMLSKVTKLPETSC